MLVKHTLIDIRAGSRGSEDGALFFLLFLVRVPRVLILVKHMFIVCRAGSKVFDVSERILIVFRAVSKAMESQSQS